MKRCIIIAITAVILLFLCFSAGAEEIPENVDDSTIYYSDAFEKSGINDLKDSVPDAVNKAIDDLKIDLSEPKSLLSLKPEMLFKTFLSFFTGGLITPIRITAVIVGFIMIIAAFGGLLDSSDFGFSPVMFVSAATTLILIKPMFETASGCTETVKTASVFIAGFIPIMATIVISMGRAATAASSSALLLGAAEVISQTVTFGFLPAVGGYMCLGICSSISPIDGLTSLCETVKNFYTKTLTVILTAFIGLISIQTVISSTADGIGLRAGKVLISGGVPVLGTAISETLGIAGKCIQLLGSTAGIYAVLVVILIMLPSAAELLCWRLCLFLCSLCSEALGIKKLSTLFKSIDYCISVILGVLIFIALLFIISLTVVLKAGSAI